MKRWLVIGLFFLAAAVKAETFGRTTQAGLKGLDCENSMLGGLFIPPSTGTADSIYFYRDVTGAADSFKAALYICRSADTSLVDSSEHRLISIGNGWVGFALIENTTVYQDSTYWIAVWGDDAGGTADGYVDLSCSEATSATNCPLVLRAATFVGSSWPSTLTSFTKVDNREVSIYCVYTPSAAEGLPNYIHGAGGVGLKHGAQGTSKLHSP
jgi:hypothetical protein